MEKVLYVVWRDAATSRGEFAARLRTSVAQALVSRGARGVQVNVDDDDVTPATHTNLTPCQKTAPR